MIDVEKIVSIDELLKVTDIHEDVWCEGDEVKTSKGIQIRTASGNYIELYDNNTWEYFERGE